MLRSLLGLACMILVVPIGACGSGGSSTPPPPPVPVVAVWAEAGFIDPISANDFTAALANRGIAVTQFTGTTAAEWTAGLTGANIVVEPGASTNSSWVPSAAAQAVIQDFVQAGGRYLLIGNQIGRQTIANSALGLSLVELPNFFPPIAKTAAATGTAFDACLATLPANSVASSLDGSSLPPGSITYYETNQFQFSAISIYPIGAAGRGGHWGWNAQDAPPTGATDGGWLDALDCLIAELLAP